MRSIQRGWITALAVWFCAAAVLFIYPEAVSAEVYWPEGLTIATPNAIVMEAETGAILYEKDAQTARYPASITKILTTLLAIEYCDMDEVVTFSADAVNKNEGDTSHIARDIGEEMTMEQCLYAVMLASANECAYAVAEHVGEKLGGDYQTFIDLMNAKAEELGCVNTHFNNCNGLPDEEHWTCAYDMALIAQAAYQNAAFRTIAGTGKYTIPATNKHSEETYLLNHHNMLYPYSSYDYLYDYCTGGKTGYTTDANSTLVTFAEKDGMTLICVVMYTDSPNHYTDTRSLLDYCFSNFTVVNIAENEDAITGIASSSAGLMNTNEAYAEFDQSAYVVLPTGASLSDVTFEASSEEIIAYLIAAMTFYYWELVFGSVELVATGAEVSAGLFGELSSTDDSTYDRVIVIRSIHLLIIAGVLVFLLLVIFICKKISDNFYIMQHNRETRRMEKRRFAKVKKRKYRKKDRLFH